MMMWCSSNMNSNDIMPPHFYVEQMECEHKQHNDDVVHIICEPSDVTLDMCDTYTHALHMCSMWK